MKGLGAGAALKPDWATMRLFCHKSLREKMLDRRAKIVRIRLSDLVDTSSRFRDDRGCNVDPFVVQSVITHHRTVGLLADIRRRLDLDLALAIRHGVIGAELESPHIGFSCHQETQ